MQYELADASMISARAFDDEIVVAHFGTGVYYSLRFAAADIWLGLMAGVPADQVVRGLAPHSRLATSHFADAATGLISTLESEQLIRPTQRRADTHWQPRKPADPYDVPVIERFTDMEDLLLLDPIHDIGRTGWPDLLRSKAD